jgi:hypothetical protein
MQLLTFDPEHVEFYGYNAVGIDRDVKDFLHDKVVSRPLTDKVESVRESLLEW